MDKWWIIGGVGAAAFGTIMVNESRGSLTDVGDDPFECPGCGVVGTPLEKRGKTYLMVCEEPYGCDYDDQWEVEDPVPPSLRKLKDEG